MRKPVALIVRHGDTEANERGVFRSRLDPPLNEKGLKQAEAAAAWIAKNHKIDRIVSSPLLRALQTADIISESVHAPVTQDRGLFPWNLGFLGGRDRETYEPILNFFVDNPKEQIPDGESLDEFEERVQDFFYPELKQEPEYREAGDPEAGYEEHGPYHCEDCIHKPKRGSPYCTHPKVIEAFVMKDRLVKVDGKTVASIDLRRGCCRFVKQTEDEDTKITVYVTHTSDVVTLENLIHGNRDGRPEAGETSVGTGGVAAIYEKDGEYEVEPVHGPQKPAEFGS